jgi:LysR family transcriptional activator of dmlA
VALVHHQCVSAGQRYSLHARMMDPVALKAGQRTPPAKQGITQELATMLLQVAERGSIAAAARALDIDPSLAAKKLAQLEALFDARLFERTTRTLRLTDAGAIAVRCAREVSASFDGARNDISALLKEPSGLVCIAASQYVAMGLLPDLLARFRQHYPRISFSIAMTDALAELDSQRFDLIVHSGRVPGMDLIGRRIKAYTRSLCAAPDYLARHGTPTCPQDLGKHTCLVHSSIEPKSWCFLHRGALIAQPLGATVQADSFPFLLELARRAMGIARVSKALVLDDLASGKLVELLPDFHCVNTDGDVPGLWLLHANRHPPYRVRLFLDFLLTELKQ